MGGRRSVCTHAYTDRHAVWLVGNLLLRGERSNKECELVAMHSVVAKSSIALAAAIVTTTTGYRVVRK